MRCEGRAGRFRRNAREFDVYGEKSLPDIREAVEPATGADTVTVIRRGRMTVLEAGLLHRCGSEGKAITQIAMGRIRRKPEQQRAH